MDKKTIFESVFSHWETLPAVIKKRYSNRSFSNDIVTIKGNLNIYFSKPMKFLLPILRLLKVLVPYQGKNVPVVVTLRSDPDLPGLYFDRMFYFPGKKSYRFCSYMQHVKDNNVIEFIRFGIGWSMTCSYDGKKVLLEHQGYVLKLFGFIIPMPLSLIMGNIYAEEEPISDDTFHMLVKIIHPIFGKTFEYNGTLKIVNT